MKHLKRKRKSNYSVKETQTLIREIHKRRDVLFSRQQNTAINELKRRAWDEVADCVNSLGEGELRTAAEVKRRYLDWRAMMKRKQIRAELSGLKNEYDHSSPDNDNSLSGDQSVDLSGFPKDSTCDWHDLPDLGEPSSHPSSSIKLEDEEGSAYRLDGEAGDAEGEAEDEDDDCFPSVLPDVERESRIPEVFAHIDEFGMLSATKPSAARDLGASSGTGLGAGVTGVGVSGVAGADSTGVLIALERQRLDLEKHRLQVETERLQVERERLLVEKDKLRQVEVERERLQLEKERLQVERERLRLLMFQAERTPAPPPPPQATPMDCEKERKPWQPVDLEAEKLKLEKERLQLEKERLQFFKFESGRLQMEKERFQVEKDRLQLQKDGQQLALHQGH
ncbi:myb/SANT-like DNA-binding domain-containing protein 4 [Paramormyrops kingsleyae]|uniref:Myb/SANT-like DNA-binding domain-containing protein 4 n=1 Tax=Paramormyrops kingsleyae TaxID=1676925 RepID=A0A3B3QPS0_9TELE|nr:myb/SANT-like DNA-binding domain-containing protein 4 [Paramormyrops kingsleyae]